MSELEEIRRRFLRAESNVRSIGQFCYLVGFVSALGVAEFVTFATGALAPPPELTSAAPPETLRLLFWLCASLMLASTLGHAVLGYGLTHLQAWARWLVVGLTGLSGISAIGLGMTACFLYPIPGLVGLLVMLGIHGAILYPLLAPGADTVFSAGYRLVVRQTPAIRGRMHGLLRVVIALILAFLVGVIGYVGAIAFRLID